MGANQEVDWEDYTSPDKVTPNEDETKPAEEVAENPEQTTKE